MAMRAPLPPTARSVNTSSMLEEKSLVSLGAAFRFSSRKSCRAARSAACNCAADGGGTINGSGGRERELAPQPIERAAVATRSSSLAAREALRPMCSRGRVLATTRGRRSLIKIHTYNPRCSAAQGNTWGSPACRAGFTQPSPVPSPFHHAAMLTHHVMSIALGLEQGVARW